MIECHSVVAFYFYSIDKNIKPWRILNKDIVSSLIAHLYEFAFMELCLVLEQMIPVGKTFIVQPRLGGRMRPGKLGRYPEFPRLTVELECQSASVAHLIYSW